MHFLGMSMNETDNLNRWIDHLDIALEEMDEESVEADFVQSVLDDMIDITFEEAQENAR